MDELKPCPFCGGKAAISETKFNFETDPYAEYGVLCEVCRCELKSGFSSRKTAIRAWNRRVEDELG